MCHSLKILSYLQTSFWFILEYQELSFLLPDSTTFFLTILLTSSPFHTMVLAR